MKLMDKAFYETFKLLVASKYYIHIVQNCKCTKAYTVTFSLLTLSCSHSVLLTRDKQCYLFLTITFNSNYQIC